VGAHLLKWVHFEQDARGRDVELRYFRDTEGADAWQVSAVGRKDLVTPEGIRVAPALELLSTLV
jgi:hypothetical protein